MLFSQHAIWRFLHNVFRQHSIDEFLQPMWPYFPTWFVLSTYCVQRVFSQLHGRVDHWPSTWCSPPMQRWKRNNSSKIFPTHYQNHNKELHGCSSFMNIEVEIINCIEVSVHYLPDGGGHATKWKALHKMDSFVKRKDHKDHWPNSPVFGISFWALKSLLMLPELVQCWTLHPSLLLSPLQFLPSRPLSLSLSLSLSLVESQDQNNRDIQLQQQNYSIKLLNLLQSLQITTSCVAS